MTIQEALAVESISAVTSDDVRYGEGAADPTVHDAAGATEG